MTAGTDVTDMLRQISTLIDQGEYYSDRYAFMEARRLLNSQLPQAIDDYVREEVEKIGPVEADQELCDRLVQAG